MQPGISESERLFERAPRPALRPFVQRFLVVEFPSGTSDLHLPATGSVAAVSFRGRCRLNGEQWVPPAAFTGLWGSLRAHEHCDGHAVLLAMFTPAGAAAFVREPLEAFGNATESLAVALGEDGEVDRLQGDLRAADNHASRVKRFEEFLLSRLRGNGPDPLVEAATVWLQRLEGPARIDALTQHIGLSQSALERRFRRVVGVSPKRYASLVRLERAVALRRVGYASAELAYAAGYYDQSHYIHEFRRAAGCAPEVFFRTGSRR